MDWKKKTALKSEWSDMVMEFKFTLEALPSMLDSGILTKDMVMVDRFLQTALSTKETLTMEPSKVLAVTPGQNNLPKEAK
jgi:hypothetical protein